MSRAFVKEDNEQPGDGLIERQISPQTNYVTPAGLKQLQMEAARLEELRRELATHKDDAAAARELVKVGRDLRYYTARLENAVLVQPTVQPGNEILFGAVVSVEDAQGQMQEFAIVGEDEADITQNKVSWVSPLARALIGAHVGDIVTWHRPAGNMELEIIAVRYPKE
jgi:transcription elongation factor GreB